jgi:phage terminase small subunit
MPLTPKQQRFVEEYLIDLNATQSAIRAGYSAKRKDQAGFELLRNPEIAQAIAIAQEERSRETKIDAAWLLKRLAAEAEADAADLYDEHGSLKPVKEWPKIWRQGLIQGMDIEQISVDGSSIGTVAKIKLSDRVKRLELIGKHVGVQAFKEQIEITGNLGLAERLSRASSRVKQGE